jgi:hypothetical protein
MKYKVFSVLSIFLFTGCDKNIDDFFGPKDNEYKTYTIRKGEQSTNSITGEIKEPSLHFKVIFDSSAIYTTSDPGNQIDINKLYGFSDCGMDHHTASARFGWRWSDDSLRLFAYWYKNSTMGFRELGTIEIGKEHDCLIVIQDTSYVFELNGVTTVIAGSRGCSEISGRRMRLFPYFGGNENAPHDITIKIKEL